MLNRIQGIIFDMDGLMLDTECIYRSSMLRAAQELSYQFDGDWYDSFVGLSTPACRAKLMDIFGDDYPTFKTRRRELWEQHIQQVGVEHKPGLVELLDYLDEMGFPKGIATSSIKLDAMLCLGDLANRFDVIVTGDEVERGKPAPDIFLLAAERLALSSTACLVLEDSEFGAQGALAAGTTVIVIPDLQQPSDEVSTRVYRVCSSLHEVRQLLGNSR